MGCNINLCDRYSGDLSSLFWIWYPILSGINIMKETIKEILGLIGIFILVFSSPLFEIFDAIGQIKELKSRKQKVILIIIVIVALLILIACFLLGIWPTI